MFFTIFLLLDSKNYNKRYLGAFRGVENWKSVTFWRVLFIRSQSVVDVVLMRNDWKLRNFYCFLLYLNVDMIKATKGSSSGAPTPPHMHPLILKGLELHAQAFFIDASSKATLKHTSILSPDPHFCEGACGGGSAHFTGNLLRCADPPPTCTPLF